MLLLYALLFVGLLYACVRPVIKSENVSYMSKDSTNVIKGLFIMCVLIRHFSEYIEITDRFDVYAKNIDSFLGQLIVVMFLFYSGFGVMESFGNKGQAYVKKMPRKRILNTLLNFDFAVIIYMLVTLLKYNEAFSLKRFALSLIAWDSYGNSNWYIFCILAMYICAYIALKLLGKTDRLIIVIALFVLTFVYIGVLRYILPKEIFWYDTAVCFPLGCAFSLYRTEFENIINSRLKALCFVAVMLIIFALATVYAQVPHLELIIWFVKETAFVFAIVGITKMFPPQNRILKWFGENLFPIYIYQRLPMMLFENLGKISNVLYLSAVLASVVIIAFILGFVQKNIRQRLSMSGGIRIGN